MVNLQDWIKGRGSLLNNCREISYLCQLSCKCVILFSPINYRSSHFMFEFKVKIQDRKCNISENSYQGIPIFVFILHSQVTTLKECKLVNFDVPLFVRGFNIFLETIYVDMYVHIYRYCYISFEVVMQEFLFFSLFVYILWIYLIKFKIFAVRLNC